MDNANLSIQDILKDHCTSYRICTCRPIFLWYITNFVNEVLSSVF